MENLAVAHRNEEAVRKFRTEGEAGDFAPVAFDGGDWHGLHERVLVGAAGLALALVDPKLVRLLIGHKEVAGAVVEFVNRDPLVVARLAGGADDGRGA